MGKMLTSTIKSSKDISDTYKIVKKVIDDQNLKITKDKCKENEFNISAKESMKWLTTNWPTIVEINAEIFEGNVMVKLSASSKGTSITQDSNTNSFLNNIVTSIQAYL